MSELLSAFDRDRRERHFDGEFPSREESLWTGGCTSLRSTTTRQPGSTSTRNKPAERGDSSKMPTTSTVYRMLVAVRAKLARAGINSADFE